MNKFTEKVAIVTGAASGIGRALAIKLAENGCHLVLADMNVAEMLETEKLVEAYGVHTSCHELNIADADAFSRFAQQCINEHGEIHFLFNNAGVSLIDSVSNQSLEDFQWLMNINFWGVVHGVSAFLPHFKQNNLGCIVNVSSLFGLLSLPLQSAYNASKFAVRGYTESLKMEMAGSGVEVFCVHPGGIKTDITRNSRVGDKLVGISKDQLMDEFNKKAKTTQEQAAQAIIDGINKGNRRILIGADARFLDKVVRLFPSSYEKFLGFEKKVIEKFKQSKSVK